MRTDTGQVFRLEDYRPSDYLIERTDLVFKLDPNATEVRATLSVVRRAGVQPGAPLVLAGDELTLASVAVLAAIVLIRTFLSWSLELEISGRWPWQKRTP